MERRARLLESLNAKDFDVHYRLATPRAENRFSFRPGDVAQGYHAWVKLNEIASTDSLLGLNDNRMQATHDISKAEISRRMKAYYDPAIPFEDIAALHVGLTTNAASFNARDTRARLQTEVTFKEDNLRPFWFKPFDLRWAYVERIGNLWNRSRPELLQQAWPGNEFLLSRRHAPKAPDGAACFFSRHIADQHVMHTDAYFIPIRLLSPAAKSTDDRQGRLLGGRQGEPVAAATANLSSRAREYLNALGISNPDIDAQTAGLIWMHALSIGYSPAYISENADGIRQDWPRIPLPDSKEALLASAALGHQIVALLDTETRFDVGPGLAPAWPTQASALQKIAAFTLPKGTTLDEAKHFAATAGWGHAGQGGVTMPGKGKIVERDYTAEESVAAGLPRHPKNGDVKSPLLGDRTCDVYLNDVAYWSNIPLRVWEYTIGGYQVIKKWLSYREEKLLGRPLAKDEIRYVQEMARRIAAILLLEPALDTNYQNVKAHTFPWKG